MADNRPCGARIKANSIVGNEYTQDEVNFLVAIDAYKRDRRRPYPTWIEVLDVLRELGWVNATNLRVAAIAALNRIESDIESTGRTVSEGDMLRAALLEAA